VRYVETCHTNTVANRTLTKYRFRSVYDELLNIGPNARQVRSDIAEAISKAIIDDLVANS
jgi:hypothetical protein